MGTRTIDTDAYDSIIRELLTAASRLAETKTNVVNAVPILAFGPIGMSLPPMFNAFGAGIAQNEASLTFSLATLSSKLGQINKDAEQMETEARMDFASLADEL